MMVRCAHVSGVALLVARCRCYVPQTYTNPLQSYANVLDCTTYHRYYIEKDYPAPVYGHINSHTPSIAC